MSKFTDIAGDFANKAQKGTEQFAKSAIKLAKNASDNANEKIAIMHAKKKRSSPRNSAILALSDAAGDLKTCNKLTASDDVKAATEVIIQEIEKLKDMITEMTSALMIPILEEQKNKWLDDKTIDSTAENYAQQELDKSELLRRRKMAASKCSEAIEALQKQADEEVKELRK